MHLRKRCKKRLERQSPTTCGWERGRERQGDDEAPAMVWLRNVEGGSQGSREGICFERFLR